MNFNSTVKNFAGTEEKSILYITLGDSTVTDTEGATFLASMSVSNISKLARNGSIESVKQGKGRFVNVESLRAYYDTERRAPSRMSQAYEWLAAELVKLEIADDEAKRIVAEMKAIASPPKSDDKAE